MSDERNPSVRSVIALLLVDVEGGKDAPEVGFGHYGKPIW
jgi:hypothetical protein